MSDLCAVCCAARTQPYANTCLACLGALPDQFAQGLTLSEAREALARRAAERDAAHDGTPGLLVRVELEVAT